MKETLYRFICKLYLSGNNEPLLVFQQLNRPKEFIYLRQDERVYEFLTSKEPIPNGRTVQWQEVKSFMRIDPSHLKINMVCYLPEYDKATPWTL